MTSTSLLLMTEYQPIYVPYTYANLKDEEYGLCQYSCPHSLQLLWFKIFGHVSLMSASSEAAELSGPGLLDVRWEGPR